ncbi:MAG: hypothetical protein ABSH03_18155 [Candidatus Lustribacter sp.]
MPDAFDYFSAYRPAFSSSVRPFYRVARPGFFGGFGSWLDMFSPVAWSYARVPAPLDVDATVQNIDWMMVGGDMADALRGYSSEALPA